MFNSGILDTVIGVIVIFLQLSLVCTAVNEFVAMLLKKRAKELEKGVRTLLTSPELAEKFYAHPLIKGLRPDQRKPSYIPSRTFALALMDIVRRHSFDGAVTAATQAVADKEKERSSAQAGVDAAIAALQSAQAIRTATTAALAAATDAATKVAATKADEDAKKQEDAARTAKADADTKLAAVIAAKTKAEQFLTQVTADAKAAKDAETAAQTAEAAASKDPKNAALQTAAAVARQKANDAADKMPLTASSLLTEARDKVAGVQSEVVPPELKTALLALLDNAGANLNKAQANLEQWFDDAMDRVSGVYKRKSQIFVGVIAVIVTLLANVDTLQVANSLSHDKAVRDSLVAAAPELAKNVQASMNTQSDGAGSSGAGASGAGASGAGASGAGASGAGASGAGASGAGASGAGASGAGASGAGSSGAGSSGAGSSGVGSSGAGSSGAGSSGAGSSGAGNAKGNTGTPGGNPSASKTPEPSITSIKASLDELNKLGLPIGYVRVCTVLEESVVDSCVTETAANEAKAKLDTARTNADNAEQALKKAAAELQASNDAEKATNQAALAKAQAEFDTAVTEFTNAQKIHGKAAAKVEEINSLKETLNNAKAAAEKNPKDPQLQQAYREARSRVAFTTKCPKCQKESALTDAELKRRLPTTHDYQLISGDFFRAIGALLGDSWNLLYSHWFGWLITAFAISLGAPFWFDTLNRVMVIRSTVKPTEKSKEQESKDNPDQDDKKKKT